MGYHYQGTNYTRWSPLASYILLRAQAHGSFKKSTSKSALRSRRDVFHAQQSVWTYCNVCLMKIVQECFQILSNCPGTSSLTPFAASPYVKIWFLRNCCVEMLTAEEFVLICFTKCVAKYTARRQPSLPQNCNRQNQNESAWPQKEHMVL